jgi:hypothetical protein
MSVDVLSDLLRHRLPITLPGGELTLTNADQPVWIDSEGRLFVTLRIVTIDDGTIMNLHEQEIALGRFAEHSSARWLGYLEGTLRAAPAIVNSRGSIDALLPCDLFAYSRVLDDPSLHDADSFAAKLGDAEQLERWNATLELAEWVELLEPCGLADHVDEVKALLWPSLRLRLIADEAPDGDDDDEPDQPALGCTRLGGDPDLPPTQPWPTAAGEPLIFVAQFDLAELAGYPEARELPSEGLLSCFYAPFPPEGQGLAHPVAILHLRELDTLERRPAPEGCERLRAHGIELESERLFPALESAFHFETLLPGAHVQAFYESLARGRAETPPIDDSALANLIGLHSECDFDRPTHRLFGHPSSIQGDPYLDVQMSLSGWDGWREGTEDALAQRRAALGWRLLLQIDAYQDDELLLNQDGGFFYFWIPADALAVHDWSRARGCLQCH